jgi:hypothetical protein
MLSSLSSTSSQSGNNVKALKSIRDNTFSNCLVNVNVNNNLTSITAANLALATTYWTFNTISGLNFSLMRGVTTHMPTAPTNTNGTAILMRGTGMNMTQYVNLVAGTYQLDLDYLYRDATYGGNNGILTFSLNDTVIISAKTLAYFTIWKPLSSAGINTFTITKNTGGLLKIDKTIVLNSQADNSLNITNITLTKL